MSGLGSGLITLSAMLGFLAVCYWAYSRRNKKRWEEMSRLPMEDDEPRQRDDQDQEKQS